MNSDDEGDLNANTSDPRRRFYEHRGRVFASGSRIKDKGKMIALDGNQATCGHCNGLFTIVGTGRNVFDARKNIVIDQDRVLCPCGTNRVNAGVKPGVWLKAAPRTATPATTFGEVERVDGLPNDARFARWFRVTDSESGLPLKNQTFIARIGDERLTGKTDKNGYAIVQTDNECTVDIHITFSSPKRDLKPNRID